jgi:hypothetical protein
MNCPYFKEGYFGICDAPDAIHVPTIMELESFCFRDHYDACPHLSGVNKSEGSETARLMSNRTYSAQAQQRYR